MKNNYYTKFSGEGVQCDRPTPQDGGADMFALLEALKKFAADNFGENIIFVVSTANNQTNSASVTFSDERSGKTYTITISTDTYRYYGGVVDVE